MASWWEGYIRRRARQLGLDPNAVVAVARQEGLGGGVGDAGTSYGPFQLHRGGALPRGRNRAWAESPQGIDYALRQIAGVARGQTGRQAISSIVSRFERPADPATEISRALAAYGGSAAPAPAAAQAQAPTSTTGADTSNSRAALAMALISASQQSASHQTPDLTNVFSALAQRNAPTQQAATATATSAAPAPTRSSAQINELFYDPLGAIKHGQQIAPIGGHRDHVHVAFDDPRTMVAAIRQAQRMGLHVSENPYVGQVHRVHVSNSNHYRVIGQAGGRKVGGAADVAGSPQQMAAFYRWVARNL